MSPGAGGRQADRQTILRCRKCGEWEWATATVAYRKQRIRCQRCGGVMLPTRAQGSL